MNGVNNLSLHTFEIYFLKHFFPNDKVARSDDTNEARKKVRKETPALDYIKAANYVFKSLNKYQHINDVEEEEKRGEKIFVRL